VYYILLVILLVIAAIFLPLFRLLTSLSKRRNRPTPAQVADAIEKHVEGREEPWDWDRFTSVPIANDRLDAIRLRCTQLDYETPQTRLRELKTIIADLRRK